MSEEAHTTDIDFTAAEEAEGADALLLALDAFEGPLALLLELARAKKIDIAKVSVGEITDQYLAFIAQAHARDMELASDYLVMAAWLALLKSRLLLPKPAIAEDEPDPQELAAALKLKLMRLELARAAAKRLDGAPQLGRDVFLNGAPRPTVLTKTTTWKANLHDLLSVYCAERSRSIRRRAYRTLVRRAFPLEAARRKLEQALAMLTEWSTIDALSPPVEAGAEAPPRESYLASTFGAALELAREGKMDLRQAEAFAPLFVRARPLKEGRGEH